MAARARGVRASESEIAGSADSRSASQRETSLLRASSITFLMLALPMPRAGVLMMRSSETESAWLATTRRYPSAFLISSRW